MVVQENFDQYFKAVRLNANTIVLPNLPDDLHYLLTDTPLPHTLHHDSEIHN